MKTTLITGASSGIGRATARALGKLGYRIVICGRRRERLEKLKSELETDVHILEFDVRNRDEVFREIEGLPEEFKNIDILVNNAGNAHGLDPIDTGDVDDWDAMIDINI